MKNVKSNGAFLLGLAGLLGLGLVACQNAENLAGQGGAASSDLLASAKSKNGDSAQIDSVTCGASATKALAKHGADDSLPEVEDSHKSRGCDDRDTVRVRHEEQEADRDSTSKHEDQEEDEDLDSHESDNDSLEIEVGESEGSHHGHGRCESKTDSTHSDAGKH